jgi:hypothetical protein
MYGGAYAEIDYNLTSCLLQSRLLIDLPLATLRQSRPLPYLEFILMLWDLSFGLL